MEILEILKIDIKGMEQGKKRMLILNINIGNTTYQVYHMKSYLKSLNATNIFSYSKNTNILQLNTKLI